ncbi:hypothetical protein BD289DRAFT_123552 [Coniella lustricola]|uniref:Uncharacterized protein n=1 Tax=Coniella lustricola TaxID=2025994 RepID=A0A2T2ZWH6_9PEZI|nr:hypothetical protein BD289DRAFT_123552 [Coniella lustricola]
MIGRASGATTDLPTTAALYCSLKGVQRALSRLGSPLLSVQDLIPAHTHLVSLPPQTNHFFFFFFFSARYFPRHISRPHWLGLSKSQSPCRGPCTSCLEEPCPVIQCQEPLHQGSMAKCWKWNCLCQCARNRPMSEALEGRKTKHSKYQSGFERWRTTNPRTDARMLVPAGRVGFALLSAVSRGEEGRQQIYTHSI